MKKKTLDLIFETRIENSNRRLIEKFKKVNTKEWNGLIINVFIDIEFFSKKIHLKIRK